jgi:ligand-binding sensor domain-containing protein
VVLFEDSEGNIWAATTGGLDRFREMPVVTYSEKQNLPAFPGGSVLTARDGSVWVNTADGLSRWNRGQVTVYHAPGRAPAGAGIAREVAAPGIPRSELFSLFEDRAGGIWIAGFRGVGYLRDERLTRVTGAPSGVVVAMAEDTDGGLWIANLDHGLIRIRGGRADPPIPWTRLNHRDHAGAMAADPAGGIWLGFFEGGATLFRDGEIRAAYNGVNAPGRGHVNDLQFDSEGTLWAATEGGLSAFRNGAFANLGRDNGLPCEDTFRMIEDDDHAFWLSMACGLVRIEGSELRAWLRDPKRRVEGALYDGFDGVGPRRKNHRLSWIAV